MLQLHLIQAVLTALILQCDGGRVHRNCGPSAHGNKVSNIQHVVEAIEDFTFSLIKTVTENGDLDNWAISGLSMETVLALCSIGAAGITKEQMQYALRLSRNQHVTKRGFKTLIDQLNNESSVTLNVVSAVYADLSTSIETKFTSVAEQYFKSLVVREDFQNNPSVAIGNINSWVASITKNSINELVGPDSVTSSTKLLLLNSIYFKGFWAAPFKPILTDSSLFYIDSDNSIPVSMMHQQGQFLYYYNRQLRSQILAMGYKGNTMRAVFILPHKRGGLIRLRSIRSLRDLRLHRLRYAYVNASIPKFEISYSKDFSSTLQKLGMLDAFTPGANFSHISNYSDIFISSVLQKAYFKVDEAGTEASAVSGLPEGGCALGLPEGGCALGLLEGGCALGLLEVVCTLSSPGLPEGGCALGLWEVVCYHVSPGLPKSGFALGLWEVVCYHVSPGLLEGGCVL